MTMPAPPVDTSLHGSGPGGPLRPPPRRVRRGLVAAGVLAIVLSALGSATLFRALGPAQEHLVLARDVPAGAALVPADLAVVRLAVPPGLAAVPAGELDRVLARYAAVPLAAGSLLTAGALTAEAVPAPGEQLVAVPLPRDGLPGGTLRPGAPVLLVATNERSDDPPRTFPARVHDVVDAGGRGGGLVASVVVAERDGAAVASLAAGGRLAVVLVAEAGR
jgi:hypothetical protein